MNMMNLSKIKNIKKTVERNLPIFVAEWLIQVRKKQLKNMVILGKIRLYDLEKKIRNSV